jgi:hypothetical protein
MGSLAKEQNDKNLKLDQSLKVNESKSFISQMRKMRLKRLSDFLKVNHCVSGRAETGTQS